MTKVKTNRRDGGALALSAALHVVIIAILISQAPPRYVLPEPPAQPMDVQIITAPIIPPPPIIPPKMTPRKIETAATPPPTPPTPVPAPKPAPAPPEPPKVAPAKPAPPKVSPVVAPPTPPTPPAPRPQPAPKPAAAVAPSPPAPVAAPTKLNIHRPDKDAPADVATLPMAPAPGPARPAAPATPGTSGAPTAGSRLSGLSPFPLGAMPSGGTGLRGTLVGCANADSVHLSSVERAHCSERFGVEMNRAPVLDGIAPAKRAAFDRTAAAQEANRASGAVDPMRAMERKHGRSTDFGGGVVTGPASSFVKPDP